MRDPREEVASFIDAIPSEERTALELQLTQFVVQHGTHHRPIALVTSGGTAADLEVNAVRCLENFSTGLRGAISVEELLRRGYAVIHLWRTGSAAPFARVLAQALGLKQANHGLSVEAMGKLFAGDVAWDQDQDDFLVQQVLDQETDPWLTETTTTDAARNAGGVNESGTLSLHRQLLYSTKLQKAMKERSLALQEGRLLTVPFRTIEDYLSRLQLASKALADSQSLALMYLAAAVSDYYVPADEKSQHKIQSTSLLNDGDNSKPAGAEGLTLQLRPVPKTMGLLGGEWAPSSFLVSFKLETDKTILRRKAEAAVQKYGCHMVIGNLLQTRHSKVWILAPSDDDDTNKIVSSAQQSTSGVHDWAFHEVAKPPQQHYAASEAQDSLESAIIDFVVQSHFEYISNSGLMDPQQETSSGSAVTGMEAAKRRLAALEDAKRRQQRQAFLQQVKGHAMTIAGTVIAVVLSSAINSALQRRANSAGRRY